MVFLKKLCQTRNSIIPNPNPSQPDPKNPTNLKSEPDASEISSGGFGIKISNPKPEKPELDAPEPEKSDPCSPLEDMIDQKYVFFINKYKHL